MVAFRGTRVRISAIPPVQEGCRSGLSALPRKQLVPPGARAFESLIFRHIHIHLRLAQSGSASALGAEGRRFESFNGDQQNSAARSSRAAVDGSTLLR